LIPEIHSKGRLYAPITDRGILSIVARGIYLPDEPQSANAYAYYRKAKATSDSVVLLGFGFEQLNLSKLQLDNNVKTESGTNYGFTSSEFLKLHLILNLCAVFGQSLVSTVSAETSCVTGRR
jgi:hypothetical protein